MEDSFGFQLIRQYYQRPDDATIQSLGGRKNILLDSSCLPTKTESATDGLPDSEMTGNGNLISECAYPLFRPFSKPATDHRPQ
jgi:hypothetical protein